jgi:uncharacterized protein YkwD
MPLTPFVGLLLLAHGTGSDKDFRVRLGASGPRTEVRYARPTLRWEVWPDDAERRIVAARVTLDGKPVEASYDRATRAVVYTPARPLAPGPHLVECRVTFDDGRTMDEKWETRVAASSIDELPPADQGQREALAAANRLRARLNLPPFVGDDRLNLAALLHSQYLGRNGATGHRQDPNAPGYFGATAALRLEAYGFVGGSWEGIDFGSRTPTEAIRNLFDAPYHRIPFLQPGRVSFGSGFHGQHLTAEFGLGDAEGTVVSPADGQTEVPTSWRNFERPDPLRAFPGAPKQVGYPIVVVRHGRRPTMKVVSATLAGPEGENVPCYLTAGPKDESIAAGAILIPCRPLLPQTEYTVVFTETDERGAPRTYRAQFRTGSA